MPRLVTVWFPQWSAAAAGAPFDEPLAVVHANRVVSVSTAAEAAGIRIGLRRREAQACCATVRIVQQDVDRDARRFEPVVRAVADLVPLIEVTEPGLITFASRGPSRYVGGDVALAARLVAITRSAMQAVTDRDQPDRRAEHDQPDRVPVQDQRDRVPVRVAVGIAEGHFASGVAARRAAVRGEPCVIPAGAAATTDFLAPFPVDVLHDIAGFSTEFTGLLRRLGITRLHQLAALPAADLLARFGNEGIRAHRLASGNDERPADTQPVAPELVTECVFDDPVAQVESLVFAGRQLADQLHQAISGRGVICVRLAIEAETDNGERTARVWYQPAGLRVATMVERVRWQLDGWVRQPGGLTGGVVLLRLTPVELKPDTGRQLGFWGGRTQADEWAQRAITRLGGLLGPDAVTVPVWRGGREPARQYELIPAVDRLDLETTSVVAATGGTGGGGTGGDAATCPPWPGRLPKPSPSQLFVPAEACVVEDDCGRGVTVSGRGFVSGPPATLARSRRRVRVAAWAGPWPIEERWWDAGGRRRARFQLVTEEGIAYLAAVEAGQWWLDGVYS